MYLSLRSPGLWPTSTPGNSEESHERHVVNTGRQLPGAEQGIFSVNKMFTRLNIPHIHLSTTFFWLGWSKTAVSMVMSYSHCGSLSDWAVIARCWVFFDLSVKDSFVVMNQVTLWLAAVEMKGWCRWSGCVIVPTGAAPFDHTLSHSLPVVDGRWMTVFAVATSLFICQNIALFLKFSVTPQCLHNHVNLCPQSLFSADQSDRSVSVCLLLLFFDTISTK